MESTSSAGGQTAHSPNVDSRKRFSVACERVAMVNIRSSIRVFEYSRFEREKDELGGEFKWFFLWGGGTNVRTVGTVIFRGSDIYRISRRPLIDSMWSLRKTQALHRYSNGITHSTQSTNKREKFRVFIMRFLNLKVDATPNEIDATMHCIKNSHSRYE